MKHTLILLALVVLAGCERAASPPPAAPPAEEKDSVELKLDTQNGAVEFKQEEGGGDTDVDVEVKTE